MAGTGALRPPGTRFAVRLVPRGGADQVEGVVDGVLRARVSAPPVAGAANHALLRLIAEELGIPQRDVRLVAGAGGRTKVVMVDNLDPGVIAERWPGLKL